jgi:hypothetical protein
MGGPEGALTMPRADLLALSPDDLAALTNRGTVKRALRELEAGEVRVELEEAQDGTVTARSSDGVECRLPGGAVVAAARCSCPATELCRHVVRAVLAYQAWSKTESVGTPAAWDPGAIPDEALAGLLRPAVLAQARTQFEGGLLIELVRSAKPTARFHDLACTLRFQVPGDARYVHCDCAGEPPCAHVALAVWAFRRLPGEQSAGILSTQERRLPTPTDLLDQFDEVLLALLESGLAGAGGGWRDRLARLENHCRGAGLVWPAAVIADVLHQFERYAEHDARFSPERLAELVGELLIRADAIRRDTGAVPQLFVRGTATDRWTDLASARFVGLGCGVRPGRRSARVTAFLQDANSGSMVAVCREFADPAPEASDPPKQFWQLAQALALKGATFAQLGTGQLLTQGGRRAADHQLVLGRAKATVNPQNFSWETLRAPVLAEGFAEVRARLVVLPPSALRPRRVAEDFHVSRITGAENAAFLPGLQLIQAILRDTAGDTAILRHPFTSRGDEGSERLLHTLRANPKSLQFVAGPMRMTAEGLVVEPVGVVVHESSRVLLQPWVDRLSGPRAGLAGLAGDRGGEDPVAEWNRRLLNALGDLLVTGLRRVDPGLLRALRQLETEAEALGMARIALAVRRLAAVLTGLASVVEPDLRASGRAALDLAVLARVAQGTA